MDPGTAVSRLTVVAIRSPSTATIDLYLHLQATHTKKKHGFNMLFCHMYFCPFIQPSSLSLQPLLKVILRRDKSIRKVYWQAQTHMSATERLSFHVRDPVYLKNIRLEGLNLK